MGSCSFAGLRDQGSFLRLFSVESGFCSRAVTMGPSAAGWHRRRSVQHCHRSSMAICYLVVSSTLSHCPQPLQETEAEFVPSQLCTYGFSLTGRHRYPENSFSPQVLKARLLEWCLDPHTATLLFIYQVFYSFIFIYHRAENLSLDLHFSNTLSFPTPTCGVTCYTSGKTGSIWCCAQFTPAVLKTFKNALNLHLVLTLVSVILSAL